MKDFLDSFFSSKKLEWRRREAEKPSKMLVCSILARAIADVYALDRQEARNKVK